MRKSNIFLTAFYVCFFVIAIGAIIAAWNSCYPEPLTPTPTNTPQPSATATAALPTEKPQETYTPTPTNTNTPTQTLEPTPINTPQPLPTNTDVPPPTDTPEPEVIIHHAPKAPDCVLYFYRGGSLVGRYIVPCERLNLNK